MNILIVAIWAIPYVLWTSLLHLWLSNKCFVCGYKDNRVRPVLVLLELVIDLIIAIFYFEGPFHPISNFIIFLFKN